MRLIEAPKQALKRIQRRILDGILRHVPVHDIAFGFVPGRNCIDAAQRHCGEALVISFDLKDFFPSIAAPRITALFRGLGYPAPVADLLTALCTLHTPARVRRRLPPEHRRLYAARHLPQGAPTSPTLANLCAFRLDCRLAGLARRLDANISRYADDITFSGDATIRLAVLGAVPEILAEEGFVLNPAKTRVQAQGQRQMVTGLVVNTHVNTPRREYDQLKAILHHCARPEDTRLSDPAFREHIEGRIGWVAQVNPARAERLRERFTSAMQASGEAA
ncbi:reverse transcriptase family protein [Halovulum sp. GXIMD14793]